MEIIWEYIKYLLHEPPGCHIVTTVGDLISCFNSSLAVTSQRLPSDWDSIIESIVNAAVCAFDSSELVFQTLVDRFPYTISFSSSLSGLFMLGSIIISFFLYELDQDTLS